MKSNIINFLYNQGFQILTDPPHQERPTFSTFMSTDHDFEAEEYFLSIGRNIHRLSVVPKQSQINVTRYRPRHIRGLEPINYWYDILLLIEHDCYAIQLF